MSDCSETPALIPDRAVAAMFSISRATIWRKVNAGEFPKPVKIAGRTLWRRDELLAEIDRATAERDVV